MEPSEEMPHMWLCFSNALVQGYNQLWVPALTRTWLYVVDRKPN
jgi:hypothetical protein